MATTGSVAACAARGVVEGLHLHERHQFHFLYEQLGYPVTADEVDRLARVVVDETDLDLASIAGIDGARRVDDRQP